MGWWWKWTGMGVIEIMCYFCARADYKKSQYGITTDTACIVEVWTFTFGAGAVKLPSAEAVLSGGLDCLSDF